MQPDNSNSTGVSDSATYQIRLASQDEGLGQDTADQSNNRTRCISDFRLIDTFSKKEADLSEPGGIDRDASVEIRCQYSINWSKTSRLPLPDG